MKTVRNDATHVAHLIPAFVAGTLEAVERRNVLAHLSDCSVCRAELAAWHAIGTAAKDVYSGVSPADGATMHTLWRRIDEPANDQGLQRRRAAAEVMSPVVDSSGATHPKKNVQSVMQRSLIYLATAALVLLALTSSLVAYWGRRGSEDRAMGLPAAATATMASQTLFATTLPAAMLPTVDTLDLQLWNGVLDPGAHATFLAEDVDCCRGPQVIHLLEGELKLRVEGPMQLFRAAEIGFGAGEVSPGAEVLLRPGDTALYDYGLPAEMANAGALPVRIIGSGILSKPIAGAVSGGWEGGWAAFTFVDTNERYPVPAFAREPIALTLARTTLPPQGTLTAPSAGAIMVDVGAAGDASIAQGFDGSLRNIGADEETIYVLTLEPAVSRNETVSSLEQDAILLKGTFDEIPALASRIRLERVVLAPGVERPLGRYQDDGEGPLLFLVESGALTINTEGPIEVTRAGALRPESIAAGKDVVLAAGDRGFNPSGVVSRWSNAGTLPVKVIDAGVTTAGRWLMVDGYEEDALEEVNVSPPDFPFVFSVRRMTLAADETLAVDSVPGLELLRVESGTLVATDAQDAGSPGIPFLLDKGRADHGNFPPGRIFRSADGAPVTLLIVTITEVNPLEVGG